MGIGVCNRTLEDLVDAIGCQLNDMEKSVLQRVYEAQQGDVIDPDDLEQVLDHLRWSEAFITDTINDGLRIFAIERPDLFTDLVCVELQPGRAAQRVPAECLEVNGLSHAVSCEGDYFPTAYKNKSQLQTALDLQASRCTYVGGKTDAQGYRVSGIYYDPNSPRVFYVEPPPPAGSKTSVALSCLGSPPCYNWPEDKDKIVAENPPKLDLYEPWLIEFSLYRAFIQDNESPTSMERSEAHWKHGFTIITEGKTSDYAYHHPDLYLIGPIKEGTGNVILRSG